MNYTKHYKLKLPDPTDYAKIADLNENASTIDGGLHALEAGKEPLVKSAAEKETPADTDAVALVDSAEGNKTKRLTWANIKAALNNLFYTKTETDASLSTKANQAEVLAALAGKADAMVILDSGDISQLVPLKSTGFVATPAVTGTPQSAWWIGSAETTGTIFRVDLTNVHYPSESHRRTYQNGNWTGWVKIPTAEPPTEHPLPLAAGMIPDCPCRYFKTQDGVVTIILSVSHSAELSPISTIATLPEGFRPTTDYYFAGLCYPSMQCALFGITSVGEIKIVSGILTGGTSLALSCTFVAH